MEGGAVKTRSVGGVDGCQSHDKDRRATSGEEDQAIAKEGCSLGRVGHRRAPTRHRGVDQTPEIVRSSRARLVDVQRALPLRRTTSLDQMRPESDEHNPDDHRENKTEKTTDKKARKHDRCHPDPHRHQDSHAVAPRMEQAAERPDEQPKHNQTNDVKNHDHRLPVREVKKPEVTAAW